MFILSRSWITGPAATVETPQPAGGTATSLNYRRVYRPDGDYQAAGN